MKTIQLRLRSRRGRKKKMKEGLDNKFSNEFYKKANAKHLKTKGINNQYEGEEDFEESEGQLLYEKQREYYLKMLECIKTFWKKQTLNKILNIK